MRINSIKIQNLIGIRNMDAELDDVTLFAGFNWSGKTSIQQAVRLALCRELPRVRLKGDADKLVNDTAGKQGALVAVDTSIGTFQATISKGGKLAFNTGPDRDHLGAIDCALSPSLFGSWDATQRRTYLCAAFDIVVTAERVTAALESHDVPPEIICDVAPLLAGGSFETAEKEAESRCKEYRATWKLITSETYGHEKAETWEAPAVAISPAAAAKEVDRTKGLEALANKELAEFSEKLTIARAELAKAKHRWVCEHCGVINEPKTDAAAEINARLPEMESALEFLETARNNRARDRIAAEGKAQEAAEQSAVRERTTASAKQAHERVQLWVKIKQLMSPDGLPAALIADALHAVNVSMRDTAENTGWPQTAIANDMTITVGNRLYELCSEAERWTADAAIAEALSSRTGTKLIMLDRVDVLGVERRGELLLWCHELALDGTQVILCATLKGPANIEGVRCYWVHHGELQAMEAAG